MGATDQHREKWFSCCWSFFVAWVSPLRRRPEGFAVALWTASHPHLSGLIFLVAGISRLRARQRGFAVAPLTPSPFANYVTGIYRGKTDPVIPKERRSHCWKRRFCLLNLLLMLNRRTDEIAEQRMRTVRTALQFRMELHRHIPRMVGESQQSPPDCGQGSCPQWSFRPLQSGSDNHC